MVFERGLAGKADFVTLQHVGDLCYRQQKALAFHRSHQTSCTRWSFKQGAENKHPAVTSNLGHWI